MRILDKAFGYTLSTDSGYQLAICREKSERILEVSPKRAVVLNENGDIAVSRWQGIYFYSVDLECMRIIMPNRMVHFLKLTKNKGQLWIGVRTVALLQFYTMDLTTFKETFKFDLCLPAQHLDFIIEINEDETVVKVIEKGTKEHIYPIDERTSKVE